MMNVKLCIYLSVFLLFVCVPVYAKAAPIKIDLPFDHVDITLGFSGTTLNVYGTYHSPADIVVVVRGPQSDITVRQKRNAMGMWMNADDVTFKDVPTFYDYAATSSLQRGNFLKNQGIGPEAFDFQCERKRDVGERRKMFLSALVQGQQKKKLVAQKPQQIKVISEGFFKTSFSIPANAPTGFYDVTAYLFQDGKVAAQDRVDVRVAQVGFSASVHSFAIDHALFYGLGTIMLALFAGLIANIALRRD